MTVPTTETDALEAATADALGLLLRFAEEQTGPEAARGSLPALRAAHPDLEVRLLWETESFDDSVHYDLLLSDPGRGTVSLSYAPDRALPWPMRGAQSSQELILLTVDDVPLSVGQAVAYLDFVWDQAPLVERLIDAAVMGAEIDREPVELPRAAVQAALDAFRRAKGLYTPEATLAWLKERGVTPAALERLLRDTASVAALRERAVGDQVEAYLDDHLAEFDTVHLARVSFADEAEAEAARDRIAAGTSDLFREAQRRFLASAGDADGTGNLFATVKRQDLEPDVAAALFAASPGTVVGPLREGDGGSTLFQVLGYAPAVRDAATRNLAAEALFAGWLAARRRAATIDWNWGDERRSGIA